MADVSIPAAIYTLVVVTLFILLYEKGKKKYAPYVEALSKKEYPLKSLLPVGFSALDLIKPAYSGNIDRKLRRQLRELKEEEYIEFYLRVTWALAAAYLMLGLFFSALLSLACVGVAVIFAAVAFGGLLAYSAFADIDKKVLERHAKIVLDLPDFTNKLLILSGAGLTVKGAMVLISKEMERETPFYQELKHSVYMMENGATAEQAMDSLCNRCNMPQVRRLVSVLLQNMHSGGVEVLIAMREISRELWNNRRAAAKTAAEEAGTKLLFPMMLMLLAVVLVVAAPAVMSLSLT